MSGQATPPADNKVLRFEQLPMAESRTAAYEIVREAGPVARDDHGAYVITTSEGAEYALRQPGLFSSKRAFDGVGSPVPMVPIGTDPPEHTRYRRLLQPMFSPRSTAPWQPRRQRDSVKNVLITSVSHSLEQRQNRLDLETARRQPG